jgi:hypothetical protein
MTADLAQERKASTKPTEKFSSVKLGPLGKMVIPAGAIDARSEDVADRTCPDGCCDKLPQFLAANDIFLGQSRKQQYTRLFVSKRSQA